MRFLHTGDLHLDSAFGSRGATGAAVCRERQRSLLKRIFALAERESCDMMLISGDLFDTLYVSPETERVCLELFESFEKPIIIAPGNHDPYVSGGFYARKTLPSNVYVFNSSDLQYFDFPELAVTVAGYAFTSPSLISSPLAEAARSRNESERALVLCAHADVGAPVSRYAPVLESDIERHGFDYAALGHVHKPACDYLGGTARYCGFPEGRAFDETGDGGVYIVDIDEENSLCVTRHVTSRVRYVWEELSMDEIAEPSDAERLISDRLNAIDTDALTNVRLELIGVVPDDAMPELRALEQRLGESLASLEIIDETLCLPDGDYLQKDVTLRGEFYRTLKPLLFSDDAKERATAQRALRIGLAAIEGKDFTDRSAREDAE